MSRLLCALLALNAIGHAVSFEGESGPDEIAEPKDRSDDGWFHRTLERAHRNGRAKHHEDDSRTIEHPLEDGEKKRVRRRHVRRRQVQESDLPDEVLDIFDMRGAGGATGAQRRDANKNKRRRQAAPQPSAVNYYQNTHVPNGNQINTYNHYHGLGGLGGFSAGSQPFLPFPSYLASYLPPNFAPFRCYYIVIVPYFGEAPAAGASNETLPSIANRFFFPDQLAPTGDGGYQLRPTEPPQAATQRPRPMTQRPRPAATSTTTRPFVPALDVEDDYYDDFGTDTGISLQPVPPPGPVNRPVPPLLHGSSARDEEAQQSAPAGTLSLRDGNAISPDPASSSCGTAARRCCSLNKSQWNSCFKNNGCDASLWSPHPCESYRRTG